MIRARLSVLAAALAAVVLSGCGRDRTLASCEPTERYQQAASAPPIQIPDDLSPPDESDSLRLPPEPASTPPLSQPCLESPPGFYAEGAPGGTRLGNASTPPRPSEQQAAEPAPPPADNPDREISN